jgi:hypothetical protein
LNVSTRRLISAAAPAFLANGEAMQRCALLET